MKAPRHAGRVVADSTNREHWLQCRAQYVTASDIAKAMSEAWTTGKNQVPGHERYQALLELKRGLREEEPQNERMFWGSTLEDVIVANMTRAPFSPLAGWEVSPAGVLIEDEVCKRLAATADFWANDGNGLMVGDLKCSGYEWKPSKAKPRREQYIPRDYQLQLQAQMACTGTQRGVLVQFVGNRIAVCEIFERDEETIRDIRSAVEWFWMAVQEAAQ